MDNEIILSILKETHELSRRLDRLESMENEAVYPYTVSAQFVLAGIADNTATSVFTITTTNETGSTDGGGYTCFVHALVGHAVANNTGNGAACGFQAEFARVMIGAGTGTNSAVSEVVETASAATSGATRDIASITMTVVETSEYVQDVKFTIDLSGSAVSTAEVICVVELIWYGFLTPPVLAAA